MGSRCSSVVRSANTKALVSTPRFMTHRLVSDVASLPTCPTDRDVKKK